MSYYTEEQLQELERKAAMFDSLAQLAAEIKIQLPNGGNQWMYLADSGRPDPERLKSQLLSVLEDMHEPAEDDDDES